MDGFAEAECRYNVDAHAAECVEQINTFGIFAPLLNGCTELFDLVHQ